MPAPAAVPEPRSRASARASVAVLGAGFSGLAVAIELEKAGIDDFVILERAAALGGTWRDNVYPGCACDVPSYLYELSGAPGYDWTRAYAPQPEIQGYLERCADAFDLRRHIRFEREVVEASWDDASAAWTLRTRAGERFAARALVIGVGALSNPAIPELPGIERFRGPRFHSARWDRSADLRGKRVAVIGTGASAIQFIPQLQPQVARLHVLQRTPPWIIPRHDRAFRRWERALLRFRPIRRVYRQSIHWRLEGRALAFEHPALMRVVELQARRHMRRAIRDPALRALLTPSYRAGCKRILVSDDYYPALARPNVEVVADEVREVDEHGLTLAGGRRLEVDAIVYGTGFRVHDYLGGMKVTGRGGVSLAERWKDGAEAYLGTTVAGFPNLFLMSGPNTGLGHTSVVLMFEGQARYAVQALRLLRDRGSATLEVKPDVQAAYNAWLRRRLPAMVWSTGCTSWYLDSRGRNTTLWPGLATAFRRRTARLRPSDFHVGPAAGGS